ncbi:hypothetical protein AAFP30_10585 [Gordonia sp. CPCC 205515]|uniref:hypothetical protein n=1 Tax=Gordonia sp. CPCC 205515 TaxID=3140791 RepID=UPI003AF3E893
MTVVDAATDPDLVRRVHALTGFDSGIVDGTGTEVAVFGIGGTGVTSFVEACHAVDPSAAVSEGRWRRRQPPGLAASGPTDRAVGIALMLLDPSSSIGDEERAAIEELRSRFGIVALVCTKIDVFWEWPRILRAHRGLLDPHEQLPVFAVSSLAALSGAADESGIPAVLDWIREHLAAPDDLRRERARVAAALGALEHAEASITRAADTDAAEIDAEALTRRRRAAVESRDRGRADRLTAARTGLARARSQSMAEVASGCRALATAATTRCASLTATGVDDYVGWLRAEVTALGEHIEQAVDARIEEVRAVTTIGIDADPGDIVADSEAELRRSEDPAPASTFGRPVPTGRRGAEDAMLVIIGASTGVGFGRLIVAPMASVQTLQWVSMPLTLLLGVAIAAWVIRVRRTSGLRAEIRGWTTDALGETRGRLEQLVASRMAAAEPRLLSQITRYHERRTRQVAAEIAGIDDQLRARRAGGAEQGHRDRLNRISTTHRDLAALSVALTGEDGED